MGGVEKHKQGMVPAFREPTVPWDSSVGPIRMGRVVWGTDVT